jgi:uncharacterized protein (TIGR02145 family)
MRILLYLLLAPLFVFGQGEQRYADGTATDQDGNTFEWISYGYGVNSFHWAIENADVVTYNDGTPIPQVLYPTEWSNLTTGAWCYYNNDPSQERLYNWYAINHPRFAPEGWRVASKDDYTLLIDYLSNNNYIIGGGVGKAMASTTGWNSSTIAGAPGNDQNSNNRSGFNAFPEPYRSADGSFYSGGASGKFWTTTPFNYANGRPTSAYFFNLSYNWNLDNSNVATTYTNEGISVRFVRDAPNDTEAPVITLNGANPITINQGDTYIDPGATAYDNVNTNVAFVEENNVNVNIPGTYSYIYTVTDSAGNTSTVTRTVIVRDIEVPIIALNGNNPFQINQGAVYNDPGATATDNVDGDISQNIVTTPANLNTSEAGTFTITYSVSDAAGNSAIPKTRTVNVLDTEPPVITLLGENPIAINQGDTYTDPGVSATDNVDGHLTSSIIIDTSALDTSVPGTYTVTYSVTDSAGNTSTVTRTVNVIENPTVFAGPDQTICEDETVTLVEATASNYSSLYWTTSGDGTFNPSNIYVDATYIPGPNDIILQYFDLTLSVQESNGQEYSDTARISITSLPTVNAGSDFAVNEDETIQLSEATASNFSSLYWTTSGNGSFNDSRSLNPIYTPSQQDTINGSVTLTMAAISYAPCSGVVTDTVIITINPNPTVDAGLDLSVCQGEQVTLVEATASNYSSLQWYSSGDGTFSNSSIPNPVYTPGPNDITTGSVTLTLTADGTNGVQASDIVVISFTRQPIATIDLSNSPTTACLGTPITLNAQVANNGANDVFWQIVSGTGTLSQADPNNPVYTPESDSNIVRFRASVTSTGSCTAVVEEFVTVTVTQTPEISSFQADASTYQNTPFQITGVTTNGNESGVLWSSTGSGNWSSTTILNSVYIPSAADVNAGTVTLTMAAIPNNPPCDANTLAQQSFVLTFDSSITEILLNGTVSAENNQIKNVADPTDAQDVTTKSYVDNSVSNTYTQAEVDAIISETIAELQDQIDALQAATGSGTVTDQDGNSYPYLTYGDQVWTVKDAEMVTYRDGTPIPQVTDATEWANLTTGAWAYYENDPTKGKLYNWYAVAGIHDYDPNTPNKELAPDGWHVPSDAEWTTLENYLIANGYNYDNSTTENKIGKAMASTTGWNSSTNTGAPGNDQSLNNISGFNALPEGKRHVDGWFSGEGNEVVFWSTTESTPPAGVWERGLFNWGNQLNSIYRGDSTGSSTGPKRHGFSVRLVKD